MSFVRGTREEATKTKGHARGARIVKAASHKHPHNDLCDERPFGDSFFVLLHPIFLSLRSRCARAYTFSALFLSLSLSAHIMHHASLSLFSSRTMPLYFVSSPSLFFFPIPPRVYPSFSRASSIPFLFNPLRNSSRCIFSTGKYAGTRRAQLGACINIRLIMLDATITSPLGHRCAQVGSLRVQP